MSLIRRSVISRRNEGKRNKKGGFTLIELTVVLAIMAIILTVIAPNFSSVKDSAKTKVDQQNCAAIERSVEMLLAEDAISSSVTNIKITSSKSCNLPLLASSLIPVICTFPLLEVIFMFVTLLER